MLRIVLTSFTVIALMGMAGCATMLKGSSAPVNINSAPIGANVEIKTSNGVVITGGQTPMTTKLVKGKDYTVTISLDGYEPKTVSILKGDIDFGTAVCGNLLCTGLLGLLVDHFSGAMYKLEPNTINVSLQKVTSMSGGDEVIYAFLTLADEDGQQSTTAVEMTPLTSD